MPKKHKYPKRPWNDGDRWIDGVRHAKPRQTRGLPLAPGNIHRGPTSSGRGINTGIDHVTRWKPISARTIVELAVKDSVTPEEVAKWIRQERITQEKFRQGFCDDIQEAVDNRIISEERAIEIFQRFRPVMVD